MAVRTMPRSERAVSMRSTPLLSFDPLLVLGAVGLGVMSSR